MSVAALYTHDAWALGVVTGVCIIEACQARAA